MITDTPLPANGRPVAAHKAKPVPTWQRILALADAREWAQPPTAKETFLFLCAKQKIDPPHISESRYRSLRTISEQAVEKLNALYTHQLTAKIEAVMSQPNDAQQHELIRRV